MSSVTTDPTREGSASLRLAARLRRHAPPGPVVCFGRPREGGAGDGGWSFGPSVSLVARGVDRGERKSTRGVLAAVAERWRRRREAGGGAATGILVLLGYHALDPGRPEREAPPDWAWVEVDAAVVGRGALVASDAAAGAARDLLGAIGDDKEEEDDVGVDLRLPNYLGTSLPRGAYLAAVRRIRDHIAAGDVYQANLCQRHEWSGVADGDAAWRTFRNLQTIDPAPRAAWLEWDETAIASVSPETFLVAEPDGRIETWPIKGTRRRSDDPGEDARLLRELLASEKDRAELLMIVDLERNDLGRIARTGSVRAGRFPESRSYANVHHLVTRVSARRLPGAELPEWIEATFPGGSISGAPKRRARELLAEIEPVERGPFTGSLLWLGDDGVLESSILIRTLVRHRQRMWVGAGGGVVADSDPVAEWRESNDKVRPIRRELGADPEDP